MYDYHFYKMDSAGKVFGPIFIKCEDDNAAVARAQQFADGFALDVWNGSRRVALIPAEWWRGHSSGQRPA